jgi:lipopolysaccharide transport system permease protein
MVGVIDGFRWALLGNEASLYLPGFLISIGLAITLFITGALFFTKTERKFADII